METFNFIKYKGVEYLVSSYGKVFVGDKELKQRENHDGYLVVSIIETDKESRRYRSVGVHRLVAMAFIHNDSPNEKVEVNHKDYNRKNNQVDNLEWLSHADNIRYSLCNKPNYCGENNPNYGNNKLSIRYKQNPALAKDKQSREGTNNGMCRKVELYLDGVFIEKFDYIVPCCEYLIDKLQLNCSVESMRSRINTYIRKNKDYKGYTFVKY